MKASGHSKRFLVMVVDVARLVALLNVKPLAFCVLHRIKAPQWPQQDFAEWLLKFNYPRLKRLQAALVAEQRQLSACASGQNCTTDLTQTRKA